MNYKLLFAGLALALCAAATSAAAAPAGNLGGLRATDGSKLLQNVRDDYDNDYRRGDRWSQRNRWDDNDHRGHHSWWWQRRHHRDHDDRWSWGRDHDDRDGYRRR
jgi:hypothetical protein